MALYHILPCVCSFGMERFCKYGLTTRIYASCFAPLKSGLHRSRYLSPEYRLFTPCATQAYKAVIDEACLIKIA